jgi:hypothetical protein
MYPPPSVLAVMVKAPWFGCQKFVCESRIRKIKMQPALRLYIWPVEARITLNGWNLLFYKSHKLSRVNCFYRRIMWRLYKEMTETKDVITFITAYFLLKIRIYALPLNEPSTTHFFFGLWGYWHCGHSWPIVPASGDSEDDCGEAERM